MVKQRVELHLHTNMSAMDGINTASEYIDYAVGRGMSAIAITDHAAVHSFPEAYKKVCDDNAPIKLIYGNEIYMVDDTSKAVTGQSNEKLKGNFTIVDIETTGLDAMNDKVIGISAYKVKDGIITARFNTYVNPGEMIPEGIVELTGITNEMVKDAPTEEIAMKNFIKFYESSVIVAHHASFDVNFLRSIAKRHNFMFSPVFIDTVMLARTLLPNLVNYRLDTICEELGMGQIKHHSGESDAKLTTDIFLSFCDKLLKIGVDTVAKVNDITRSFIRGNRRKHATVLVLNKVGLKNLYKLVSLANTDYFCKVPITPKSELCKHREGILIGSGCDDGELYHAVRDGASDNELVDIANFYDYLEIVPTGNFEYYIDAGYAKNKNELRNINKKIVEIGELTGKPVVAVSDAHYVNEDDMICRKVLMKQQGYVDYNKTPLLSMRTTEEMLLEFAWLGDNKSYEVVVENPSKLAGMVDELFSPFDMNADCETSTNDLEEYHSIRCGTVITLSATDVNKMVDGYSNKESAGLSEIQKEFICKKLSLVKKTTGLHPNLCIAIPKEKDIFDLYPIQYPAHNRESGIYTTHFDYRQLFK